jgi:probable F420-dependent oxidoreductase
VRIGISAYGMTGRDLVALAVAAEQFGFASLWLGEHVVLPVGYTSEHPTRSRSAAPGATVPAATGRRRPIVDANTVLTDPLIALGAVAGATTRIELGTAIYLVALRHPLLTARAVVTLQELSAGRLHLGVGTGWLSEEFRALGVAFESRIARFAEVVDVLTMAWAGGPFEFHGRFYDTGDVVQVTGAPVAVPLVFGGNSEPALCRAAAQADGWFASGTPSFDEAVALRDRVVAFSRGCDRRAPIRCLARIAAADPTPVARYGDAGFDDVLVWAHQVWPLDRPERERRDHLGRVAERLALVPAK